MRYILKISLFTILATPLILVVLLISITQESVHSILDSLFKGPGYYFWLMTLLLIPAFIFLYAWIEYLMRKRYGVLKMKILIALGGIILIGIFSSLPTFISSFNTELLLLLGVCYTTVFLITLSIFASLRFPADLRR